MAAITFSSISELQPWLRKSPVLILGVFWGFSLPSSEFCHQLARNLRWVFFSLWRYLMENTEYNPHVLQKFLEVILHWWHNPSQCSIFQRKPSKTSLCWRDLCRDNCEGMQLDQESSRGKQIPATDSIAGSLKRTISFIFISFPKLTSSKHRWRSLLIWDSKEKNCMHLLGIMQWECAFLLPWWLSCKRGSAFHSC